MAAQMQSTLGAGGAGMGGFRPLGAGRGVFVSAIGGGGSGGSGAVAYGASGEPMRSVPEYSLNQVHATQNPINPNTVIVDGTISSTRDTTVTLSYDEPTEETKKPFYKQNEFITIMLLSVIGFCCTSIVLSLV